MRMTKRLTAWVAAVTAVLLLLPPLSPKAAVEPPALTIPLIAPIEYTSSGTKPTAEEARPAQLALQRISQVAYDAFLMDRPLASMWIDIPSSQIRVTATSNSGAGNLYHWKITTLNNLLAIRPEYTDPAAMTAEVDRAVKAFVPEGDTLYRRLLSIHDFICSSTVYDPSGSYIYGAYGALVDNRSVCEGYAEAFKLLCDQNDIDCILVTGAGITSSGRENHMWNYVRMEDGRWYAVDATWDDGDTVSHLYFLVGSQTVVNLQNGKLFSENHEPEGDVSRTDLHEFYYPTLSRRSYAENHPSVEDSTSQTVTDSSSTESTLPDIDSESLSERDTSPLPSESESDTAILEDSNLISETETYAIAVTSTEYGAAEEGSVSDRWFYKQLNDEQKNFYDYLMTVVAPGSGEGSITSESQTSHTDTEESDTTGDTTEEKTGTTPVVTESDTASSETETVPADTSTTPDGTVPPPGTADTATITDGISVTLQGTPTAPVTGTPKPSGEPSFVYGLRVTVIVAALVTIFLLIVLTFLRFDRKHRT